MPGQPVILGPFKEGLNTLNDPSAIGDNQLADIVNFEVDIDGSLHGRPPIINDPIGFPGGAGSRFLYLGMYVLSTGTFRIASGTGGSWAYPNGGPWSIIGPGSTTAQQYANKIWVVPNASATGGSYDGTTFTVVATMPKGDVSAIYKERMFIGSGASQGAALSSRLYYSKPTDLTDWTTASLAGFIDIGQGDGEAITGLAVYNDNLIIFKTDSTYVLSYDTNPAQGSVRKVSSSIGASKYLCVAARQNALYVLHEGEIYEFINYTYTKLNISVPFAYDPSVPVGNTGIEETFICVVGDRLICRFYSKVYVYSFITRAWTRWVSGKYFGPFIKDPADISATGTNTYYAGSYLNPTLQLYQMKDGWTTLDSESMTCSIATKVYSISEQSRFKRLFWWGADLLSRDTISASAVPITGTFTIKWQDVITKTWGDVVGNSWGSPLVDIPTVDSVVPLVGYGNSRRFIKFYKSLRFREIQFTLSLVSDGTLPTSRLFNLVAYIAAKEKVVGTIS